MPFTELRFLVAEDHDFQRRTVVRMLENLGAKKVYEAPDGRVALTIIQDATSPVDIVISDLDMPDMDGMEFIRHLAESKAPVSVILTSALERDLVASVARMARSYEIRLLGVCEKPLSPAKLEPLIALYHAARAEPDRPRAC